jgi:biopolymer transport protein ExbD
MSPLRSDEPDSQEPMVELNTTPLIDVLLVLLVMLIISIPAPRHAVNLSLQSRSADAPDVKPQVIMLDLLPDQSLRWNGQLLPDSQALQAKLQQAAQQNPMPTLHIRPHRQAPYAAVAQALSSAQRQGLKEVALLDGFE